MNNNGDYGIPVPDYVEENVSTKVVKIIQSYTGVVNKMVWRKQLLIYLRKEKGLQMYEIIMRHNRPWTTREVLFFVILFVLVTYVLVRLFKKKSCLLYTSRCV